MKKFIILSVIFLFACFTLSAQKKPDIDFCVYTHDFGTVSKDSAIVSFSFVFINSGNADLKFYSASTSCPCVNVRFPKTSIKPGKASTVDVTFNGSQNRPGDFKQYIAFTTNGVKKHVQVFVTGKVIQADKSE